MSRTDQPATAGETPERPASVRSDERRRLLRGGLAAGPVLMTIVSRPVLGQTLNCGSAKVYASLNAGTSLNAGCAGIQHNTGRSPTTWFNASSWPSEYSNVPPKTPFMGSTTGLTGSAPTPNTMYAVLKGNATGLSDLALAQDIVAALLNYAQGLTLFLPKTTIQNMWNSYVSFGYYDVSPGIRWYATQLKTYLQSTWT